MNPDRIKSSILVSIQVACILLILASGPLFAANQLLLVIETAGIALGVWSLAVMGEEKSEHCPDGKGGRRTNNQRTLPVNQASHVCVRLIDHIGADH